MDNCSSHDPVSILDFLTFDKAEGSVTLTLSFFHAATFQTSAADSCLALALLHRQAELRCRPLFDSVRP